MAEIIEELENGAFEDVQTADVILFPPDKDMSDADSGDEECDDPDRLSRNQPKAQGELQVTHPNNVSCSDDETEQEVDEVARPAKKKKTSKRVVENLV